jgi:hypothetical protein
MSELIDPSEVSRRGSPFDGTADPDKPEDPLLRRPRAPLATHIAFGIMNILLGAGSSIGGIGAVLAGFALLQSSRPRLSGYVVLGVALVVTAMNIVLVVAGATLIAALEWGRRYSVVCGVFHLVIFGLLLGMSVILSHTGQSFSPGPTGVGMMGLIASSMAYAAIMVYALTRPIVIYTTIR